MEDVLLVCLSLLFLLTCLVLLVYSFAKSLQVSEMKQKLDALERRIADLSAVRKKGVLMTSPQEGNDKEARVSRVMATALTPIGRDVPPETKDAGSAEEDIPGGVLPEPPVNMVKLSALMSEVNAGKQVPIIEEEQKEDREGGIPVGTSIKTIEQETVQSDVTAKPEEGEKNSWEYFVGAKLLAWIGGFVLLLGIAYFAKYAIEHSLISPEARVAISYGIGVLLLGGGYLFGRKKFPVLSQTLDALGVATLYIATTAAKIIYEFSFFSTIWAGVFLVITTAIAFAFAVGKKSHVIAVLGIIGGFLTPYILSTGEDRTISFFCYITALNVALLGVGVYMRWYYLNILGIMGTTIMTLGWVTEFWTDARQIEFASYMFVTTVLYLGAAIWDRKRALKESPHIMLGIGIWILAYYLIPLFMKNSAGWHPELWIMGLPVAFISIPYLAHALIVKVYPKMGASLFLGLMFHVTFFMDIVRSPGYVGIAELYLLFCGAAYILINMYLARRAQRVGDHFTPYALMAFAAFAYFLPAVFFAEGGESNVAAQFTLNSLAYYSVAILIFSRIWKLKMGPLYVLVGVMMAVISGWDIIDESKGYWIWLLGIAGVLMLFPFLFTRHYAKTILPWLASALALPLFYILVREGVGEQFSFIWDEYPGVIALVYALPYVGALAFLCRELPIAGEQRNNKLALYAAGLIFFVTLAVGEQFEKEWLTIAISLEGLALLFINRFLKNTSLQRVGSLFLISAFVRFALNPEVLSYHVSTGKAPWNWYLWAYSLVALCCLFGARTMRIANIREKRGGIWRKTLSVMGVVLLFILLNLEIADFYSPEGSKTLLFHFDSSLAAKLTYSLGWGVFALGLLVFGFARKAGAARKAGIILLIVTIFKLMIYDLSHLEQLYRVGSLVGLAVITLFVSFLYQKFKSKLPAEDS